MHHLYSLSANVSLLVWPLYETGLLQALPYLYLIFDSQTSDVFSLARFAVNPCSYTHESLLLYHLDLSDWAGSQTQINLVHLEYFCPIIR